MGVEYEPQWADLAAANVAYARASGATGHGEVVTGDGRYVSSLVDPALRGLVALVLTSPPYGPSLHGRVRTRPGRGVTKYNFTYSSDPANLAAVGLDALLQATRDILVSCARLLRPGGVVAMTVRPWRRAGELIDLPGALGRAGEEAGLVLFERNVALLAGLRHDGLVPRASFFALDRARKSRRRGVPNLVIAHEDVLVFRKAEAAATSAPRRHREALSPSCAAVAEREAFEAGSASLGRRADDDHVASAPTEAEQLGDAATEP